MVQGSSNLIKAQNLTIENALRQTREWQEDIEDTADRNRRRITAETKKGMQAESEIAMIED